MNKKHFLILLVMVAFASASLFGGFQAYRYNRSMMNKSVFSNNIEVQAGPLEDIGNWFLEMDDRRNGLNYNRTDLPCTLVVMSIDWLTGTTMQSTYYWPEAHYHTCEPVEPGTGSISRHNCKSEPCHVDGL